MKFKSVYIEWEDAMESQAGWFSVDEAKKEAKDVSIVILIGFIIDETKDYILVSSHYIIDNDSVGTPFKIPKMYIRKRKEISIK